MALFGPPKRDISRLDAPDGSTEAVSEKVDLSGGPIKEGARRRALRDNRLLPKHKSGPPVFGKKKRIMPKAEADRLFAGTIRTRNRNIRDLLTDEDQLSRYGLPVWRTEADVAKALGVSERELWYFSIHREKEAQPHYITFAVPKRSGGKRFIMAPKRRLKEIQRRLLKLLIDKLPVSDYAHGFRTGRNVRTGAEVHLKKNIVMRLDLKDFFPSVTFARVRGLLIAYGYSYPVASTLAVLMTEPLRQPVLVEDKVYHVPVSERHCVQGAPTSPQLCNAVVLRLDRRLGGLAKKFGFDYTRYADDLTFSANADHKTAYGLRVRASKIIAAEGFEVNTDKTRVMGRGQRQTVTGVVVNEQLGLSRQTRRQLRAMAHSLKRNPDPIKQRILQGKLAYLQMLNPAQAARLQR